MRNDQIVRKHLLELLDGGNAHAGLEEAVSGFPLEQINRRLPDGSYSAWQLLEHMRIAQWDILEFIRNPSHVSPEFPAGYWPEPDETATAAKWKKTIEGIRSDLRDLKKLVQDPETDLFGPLPHAKDYTIFREALLVADHNAYHVGALNIIKRVMKG